MTAAMDVAPSERTVVGVLKRGAELWPDRHAVEDDRRALSYAGLLEEVAALAGGLRELEIEAGAHVALMLGNSIEHVLSWFATNYLGAVEVPINTSLRGSQIEYILRHSEAPILVIDADLTAELADVELGATSVHTIIVVGGQAAIDLPVEVRLFEAVRHHEPVAPASSAPTDPQGILYTSGTTGAPKGVVVSQAQTYGRMWPGGPGAPSEGDRTLVALPIFHVIGQCRGFYNTLIVGGTAVLVPRFSASRFWDTCRESNISFAPLVGAMVGYLLAQPPRPDDRQHPVRHVALGTTSPDLEKFRTRFGVPEISMSYGLTEAGGVLVSDAEPEGCGRLRPDFQARLVDPDGVEVAPGEVGELVLRPDDPWGVMTGYHRMPAETLEKFRGLWLHTGDLMWLRDDAMFMFAGRSADRIRVHGENVSPSDVEEQVMRMAGIRECAVVGVDAPDAGAAVGDQEILLAYVTSEPEPTMDEVMTQLANHLPRFAVPRYLICLDQLPRTEATQRVQRSRIAQDHLADAWDRGSRTSKSRRRTDKSGKEPELA